MGSTDNPYGWVIWLIVLSYVVAFVVWFLVGFFVGDKLINTVKSTARKTLSTAVKGEVIKFLKSPNQMKKGN